MNSRKQCTTKSIWCQNLPPVFYISNTKVLTLGLSRLFKFLDQESCQCLVLTQSPNSAPENSSFSTRQSSMSYVFIRDRRSTSSQQPHSAEQQVIYGDGRCTHSILRRRRSCIDKCRITCISNDSASSVTGTVCFSCCMAFLSSRLALLASSSAREEAPDDQPPPSPAQRPRSPCALVYEDPPASAVAAGRGHCCSPPLGGRLQQDSCHPPLDNC